MRMAQRSTYRFHYQKTLVQVSPILIILHTKETKMKQKEDGRCPFQNPQKWERIKIPNSRSGKSLRNIIFKIYK